MGKRLWVRWKRCMLFHVLRLFRIRGASEKVARGFSLGLIVNFFPTFGSGVLISGFLARLMGGSGVAGLVGGASLAFAWPVLFYLNLKTGGLFVEPPIQVEDVSEVTSRKTEALWWGTTFSIGAVINSLVVGLGIYFLMLVLYEKVRPGALAYFRSHAREHARKLSLPPAPKKARPGKPSRSEQI